MAACKRGPGSCCVRARALPYFPAMSAPFRIVKAVVRAAAACGCAPLVCGACGAQSAAGPSPVADGGGAHSIGMPCTPEAESNPMFNGYDLHQISLETSPTTTSGQPVCIAYHFQGRVTCPYGQDATGKAPAGAAPCTTPRGPVTVPVSPQCVDRPASVTVFWSCRCANTQGRTDDGATYCACPSSMSCVQAFTPIGAREEDISGAYCLALGAAFDAGASCSATCDPTAHPCS
jgi:hypothetical protein